MHAACFLKIINLIASKNNDPLRAEGENNKYSSLMSENLTPIPVVKLTEILLHLGSCNFLLQLMVL